MAKIQEHQGKSNNTVLSPYVIGGLTAIYMHLCIYVLLLYSLFKLKAVLACACNNLR